MVNALENNKLLNSKREHNDVNLVEEVRNMLIEAGLEKNVMECYDLDLIIQEAKEKNPEVQRFMLNSFWNLQLLYLNTDTMNARFSLVPNGSVFEWLRLFKKDILPLAINNSLPKRI